ncbi:MAG: FAD-dependent oxidoreductase [Bacteroidia bacterium]|jgi:malate dehydrogenase (quinone)|nr:FAD-dependent oxidoreductase [Bacteroidia bacterium]
MNHNVIIIGGGVSGTALLYTLCKYTNVKNIGLIEKYSDFGLVNSSPRMNSQTLHFGDIETNYTLEKAKKVKRYADMVMHYLEHEKAVKGDEGLFLKVPKMVLAVGKDQVKTLRDRYPSFGQLFPKLKMIGKEEIGKIEPRILEGRDPEQELLALVTEDGYTVDFRKLCHSFAENAKALNPDISVYMSTKVEKIIRDGNNFIIKTDKGEFETGAVVVAAGSHSLIYAKSLGYGKSYSILSMAGSFYTGPKVLNGKVYTMQIPKLPFAAVHGDPEVHNENITRFGPTAKPIFFLERYNYSTFWEYWKTFGFSIKPVLSILKISSDRVIFNYLLKNVVYDFPWIGKRSFLKEIKKIVPKVKLEEIKFAKKVGGTRPQIINNATKKLELGEAKILGDKIIFNITPSPGASTCLGNAFEDTLKLMEFLSDRFTFDRIQFEKDLVEKELALTVNK